MDFGSQQLKQKSLAGSIHFLRFLENCLQLGVPAMGGYLAGQQQEVSAMLHLSGGTYLVHYRQFFQNY